MDTDAAHRGVVWIRSIPGRMDLFTIAGACLRRWYITLPLITVVVLFSYRAYAAVEPLFASSQSIVVLPSIAPVPDPEEPAGDEAAADRSEEVNPYSGQGGSRFAVAVLTRNLNSTAFLERLNLDSAVTQSFEASSSSNQPMIHIDATTSSEEQVYALLEAIVDEAAIVLDEFQADAGAPEVTRYRIAPAVPPGPVEDATPSRVRAAGAIAVLGGGLTAALVVGFDALWTSRARRRLSPVVEQPEAPATDTAPLDNHTAEVFTSRRARRAAQARDGGSLLRDIGMVDATSESRSGSPGAAPAPLPRRD